MEERILKLDELFLGGRFVPRAQYSPSTRLDQNILWRPPYDELKKYTRLWYCSFRELQLLSQFDKSPILKDFLNEKTISDWFSRRVIESYQVREMAENKVVEIVQTLPEWTNWGKYIPGIGELSFGKLLGIIGNPAARSYVTNLWRYCGFAVIDGKLEKYVKGERGHFRPIAKSYMWVIVSNILKTYPRSPSFYGIYYYVWKEKFTKERPDWTPLRVHLSAIIKTAKMFLAHLWEVCRRTQNLPVPYPYPIEFIGHKTILPAEIALHPVKKSTAVVNAIKEVEYLLRSEPDISVVENTSLVLSQLKTLVPTKETKKERGERTKPRKRKRTKQN